MAVTPGVPMGGVSVPLPLPRVRPGVEAALLIPNFAMEGKEGTPNLGNLLPPPLPVPGAVLDSFLIPLPSPGTIAASSGRGVFAA